MADIFISYAREDQSRVEALVAALEQQGWSVFWDRRIPSGQTWRSYIGNALEHARCVIVVWSRDSVASTWVMEEADDGKQRGVLVPVLLDPVAQPRGFREIQTADLTDWRPAQPSQRLDELLKDIGALLRGAGRGDNPAPPSTAAETPDARPAPPAQSGPGAPAKSRFIAVAALAAGLGIAAGSYLALKSSPAEPPATPAPAPVSAVLPPLAPVAKESNIRPEPTAVPPVTPVPESRRQGANTAFALRAVADDPDGYTNVRRHKSASSEIVAKVLVGEEFSTHEQEGNWWLVRTKDGVSGYMHVSRIRILR